MLLLATLLALVITIFIALQAFIPGILGAITLYILSRANYFQLVYNRKWRKSLAAWTYIVYFLLILGIPVFLIIMLLSPRVDAIVHNPAEFIEGLRANMEALQQKNRV